MRSSVFFHRPFGDDYRRLLCTTLVLISLLYVQQSSARGVAGPKMSDLHKPSPRVVFPWARHRRVRSAEGSSEGHQQQSQYSINRPAHCGQDRELYIDCFLCGKVTDELLIYRWCCERETETVRFCTQLLL